MTVRDELDGIAARIRDRTFGGRIRDYVVREYRGYSRVAIKDVGQGPQRNQPRSTMNQHFYAFLEDHTTQGKIAFLHKLADHLNAIAADPAGVTGFAGWLKSAAHTLAGRTAAGIDTVAAAVETKLAAETAPVVPPAGQDPAPTTPAPEAAGGTA